MVTDTLVPYAYEHCIDISTDRIYGLTEIRNPVVFEFDDKLIAIKTTIDNYTTRGLPMSWASMTVRNGVLYRRLSINGEGHFAIRCAGENTWAHIYVSGIAKNLSILSTEKGTYACNYDRMKIMELSNGTRLSGTVYLDADTNCINNPKTDIGAESQVIKVFSEQFDAGCETDDSGRYEIFVIPDTLTIRVPGNLSSCMDTNIIVQADIPQTHDISIKIPQFYDVKATLLGGFTVRWNAPVYYIAMIENAGPPVDSAYFEFRLDPRIKIHPIQDSFITSVNGSVAKGLIKNLGYFKKRTVYLKAFVDTGNIKPGDKLCNGFSAYLSRNDIKPSNNRDSFCQLVIYSFDPNHKDCNKTEIPESVSSRLEYFIGFQNEGTDNAHNITVTDTLSDLLIADSLRIISASHPYTITLENRVLNVTFKDIMLQPKSKNEVLSQGSVKFSIYTKKGLVKGDSILNKAFIYFDLNKPVITNSAIVRVPKTSGMQDIMNSQQTLLEVYPNPVPASLMIKSLSNEPIEIYQVDGLQLYKCEPHEDYIEINVSEWSKGLYFIRCGQSIARFVKL